MSEESLSFECRAVRQAKQLALQLSGREIDGDFEPLETWNLTLAAIRRRYTNYEELRSQLIAPGPVEGDLWAGDPGHCPCPFVDPEGDCDRHLQGHLHIVMRANEIAAELWQAWEKGGGD